MSYTILLDYTTWYNILYYNITQYTLCFLFCYHGWDWSGETIALRSFSIGFLPISMVLIDIVTTTLPSMIVYTSSWYVAKEREGDTGQGLEGWLNHAMHQFKLHHIWDPGHISCLFASPTCDRLYNHRLLRNVYPLLIHSLMNSSIRHA